MKIFDVKNKYVLVTGASKGIGLEICKYLLNRGYNIVGVARNCDKLVELEQFYPNNKIEKIETDLRDLNNLKSLLARISYLDINLVVNNAGYGVWGKFVETDVEKEMNMIDLNIKTLHYMTKFFTKKFIENNNGRIINVASVAAFQPGPLFSSYFASKSYVLSLGIAINTELKKTKSKVRVVTICPGPIKTDFWLRSEYKQNNKKAIHGMNVTKYVKKTLKKALKTNRKNFLLTGFTNKLNKKLVDWLPLGIVLNAVYKKQK
ncbi:SDR family NAD(P)-dependent oxidoreductase [Spiroplasma tabanidicola]|uniref:Short-chain dehydrogenase n=1 Tax=Spiroplasma tabanidicola TaxID=324079 RepID=A0A6I6C9B2_9MOLU|nr:SDR family NAD(P)-dependent oxidoreductase [Spiroplasma tabanidicola]QGS52039.1 short-chain dehydrogenase [Spiroplasma tabanidicola]